LKAAISRIFKGTYLALAFVRQLIKKITFKELNQAKVCMYKKGNPDSHKWDKEMDSFSLRGW
jgi:hypothetical protein